jgi:hypothetical protein
MKPKAASMTKRRKTASGPHPSSGFFARFRIINSVEARDTVTAGMHVLPSKENPSEFQFDVEIRVGQPLHDQQRQVTA